jgi:hypothetical protein
MESLARCYDVIKPHLTERQRRVWTVCDDVELVEVNGEANHVHLLVNFHAGRRPVSSGAGRKST